MKKNKKILLIGIIVIVIIFVIILIYNFNKKNISNKNYENLLEISYNTDPASNVPYGYLANETYDKKLHVFVNDSTLEIRISNPNAIKVEDGYYLEENDTYDIELYNKGKLSRTFSIIIDKPLGPQYQINDDYTVTIISGISKIDVYDMDTGDSITYEETNLTEKVKLPYEMNEIHIYDLNGNIYKIETK